MDDKSSDDREKIESVSSTHLVNKGNCENLFHQRASETVILVKSDEKTALSGSGGNGNSILAEKLNDPANVLGSSKVSTDGRNIKDVKDDTHSCVIHVNSGGSGNVGENLDGESVCRICHLSSEPSSSKSPARIADSAATATSIGLVQLGCGCKDELGVAHALCAEAWFKIKGNRQCEICGETAKNVTGVVDNVFLRQSEEARVTRSVNDMSDMTDRCFHGQAFCNFLLACLILAFVLPWFFHLDTSGHI